MIKLDNSKTFIDTASTKKYRTEIMAAPVYKIWISWNQHLFLTLCAPIKIMEPPVSNKNIEISLEADGSFAVKESTTLNAIVAAFFYALFFYGVCNTDLISATQLPVYDKMLLLALVPAIVLTFKALRKRVYILINHEGIYINNFFLTSWKNFIAAEYTQEEVVGSIRDNFVLIINYYREGLGRYIKKVPLTNTQDKSEEEVIAAIQYFYDLSRKDLDMAWSTPRQS